MVRCVRARARAHARLSRDAGRGEMDFRDERAIDSPTTLERSIVSIESTQIEGTDMQKDRLQVAGCSDTDFDEKLIPCRGAALNPTRKSMGSILRRMCKSHGVFFYATESIYIGMENGAVKFRERKRKIHGRGRARNR